MLRIDGGYVSEHTETVNGKECLRVDLFLDGVTNERLLSSVSFKLLYQKDQLIFEKYKALSGSMSYANTNVPGFVQFAYISANGTMVDGTTPLLTLWFTTAGELPAGTQLRFALSEPARADSIKQGDYTSEKRTVGVRMKPFGVAPILGDVNCDCDVTAADAALLLRALVGLDTLSGTAAENAEVDGRETLSAEDAAWILRYVVRLTDRFPVEE